MHDIDNQKYLSHKNVKRKTFINTANSAVQFINNEITKLLEITFFSCKCYYEKILDWDLMKGLGNIDFSHKKEEKNCLGY